MDFYPSSYLALSFHVCIYPHPHPYFGLRPPLPLDEDLGVWLLEANPGPDFKQTGVKLQRVVARMLDETVTVALDRDLARPGEYETVGQGSGGSGDLAEAEAIASETGFTAV